MSPKKIKLILKLVLVVVVFVLTGVVITVGAMNAKRIVKQYHELSNKPINSARQFKIPFGYITVNVDGTINVEFADSVSIAGVDADVEKEVEFEGATPEDDTQTPGPDEEPPQSTPDPGNNPSQPPTPKPNPTPSQPPAPIPTPTPTPTPGETEEPEEPEELEEPEETPTPTPTPEPPQPTPEPVEPPATEDGIRAQIARDISNGLYSEADIRSVVDSLANEAYPNHYAGCVAVASVIRNRLNSPGFKKTYPEVCVDGIGQQPGTYDRNDCPENYLKAAQYILSGGVSNVGNAKFWFCKTNGFPLWAEADCTGFANVGGNIFYNEWGEVHTSKNLPTNRGYILICTADGDYSYPDGTSYKK